MALDNALFLVDRGGTNYHSKGKDIGTKMKANDSVLVQRGDEHFQAIYNGTTWDQIADTDLVLAWDGTNNRKVTGKNFKALFAPIPDVCRTERYVTSQQGTCPSAGKITLLYNSASDVTILTVRDASWVNNDQLLVGQDVWLNNFKYKAIDVKLDSCGGSGDKEFTNIYVQGVVQETDDPVGTAVHIHNCAPKRYGLYDFIQYSSGNAIYNYMCPGQKNYKKAGCAWSARDDAAYYSKIDKTNEDVYEKIKHLSGGRDLEKTPWLAWDNKTRVARPFIKYNNFTVDPDNAKCHFRMGHYFRDVHGELQNKEVEIYDRCPNNTFTDDLDYRPIKDKGYYNQVKYGLRSESEIDDENLYAIDNNGNLSQSYKYFGLFIPWATIDRQLRGDDSARLTMDPFYVTVKWQNTRSTQNYQTHMNGVHGIKFWQQATVQEATNYGPSPDIQIVRIMKRQLYT